MNLHRLTFGAAALMALALFARCSGGRAAAPTVRGVDELAAEITSAFCAWQFRCCSGVEISQLEGGRYRNEEECRTSSVALSVSTQLALAASTVRAGRTTLEPTAAAACVEAYRNRACNLIPSETNLPETPTLPDVAAILAACPDVFVGRIPVGQPCEMTAACAPGARCVDQGATGGVCFPYRKEGESCNETADCVPARNLYCRGTDFTCAKPATEGETCGFVPDSEGAPLIACEADLGCDWASQRCRRPPREREPCTVAFFPACALDPELKLECRSSDISGNGICLPAARKGDACGGGALAHCAPGLVCIPTQSDGIGICDDPPALGTRCGKDGVCGGDAICDPSSNTCEKPGETQVGLSCERHADCATRSCLSTCRIRVVVRCVGAGTTPVTGTSAGSTVDGGLGFDGPNFNVPPAGETP